MDRLLYILVFFLAVGLTDVSAQVDKRDVRRGNRDFRKENFKEAELDYYAEEYCKRGYFFHQ